MNSRKHQKNTRHTHVCIFFCIYTYLWKKLKPSINVHRKQKNTRHTHVYLWMYGKTQTINKCACVHACIMKYVHNLGCLQDVVVLLGEPKLRTQINRVLNEICTQVCMDWDASLQDFCGRTPWGT